MDARDENAELLRRLDAWTEGVNPGPLIRWAAAVIRGTALASPPVSEPDPAVSHEAPADGAQANSGGRAGTTPEAPDDWDCCDDRSCHHQISRRVDARRAATEPPTQVSVSPACTCHRIGLDRIGPWECPYHGQVEPPQRVSPVLDVARLAEDADALISNFERSAEAARSFVEEIRAALAATEPAPATYGPCEFFPPNEPFSCRTHKGGLRTRLTDVRCNIARRAFTRLLEYEAAVDALPSEDALAEALHGSPSLRAAASNAGLSREAAKEAAAAILARLRGAQR